MVVANGYLLITPTKLLKLFRHFLFDVFLVPLRKLRAEIVLVLYQGYT